MLTSESQAGGRLSFRPVRARLSAFGQSDRGRAIGIGLIGAAAGIAIGVAVAAATPLYVAAALVGAIGLVLVIADTRVGLLAFIGVVTWLPFGVVPVPLGSVKLTFLDVTLLLMLMVWLARLLLRPDSRLILTTVEPAVLLFVGIAIAAFALGTGTTSETTRLFLKWINSIVFFFTAVNTIRTAGMARLVVRGLVLLGAFSAAVGVVLYFLPTSVSQAALVALGPLGYPTSGEVLRYLPSTRTMRAIATSVDPNVYGAMLMLVGVFGASQLVTRRPVLPRTLLVIGLGLVSAALLLSYSRGSWIGLFAGCLVIAALRYRRPWVLVALVAGVALLAVLPGLGGFFSHLQSGLAARDQAAAMRLGEYKDALRLIEQYPVLGVGFGVAPEIDLYIGVSSIYLLLAEQMGLLGLASFCGVVGIVAWRAVATALRHTDTAVDGVLVGAVAALAAALVAGALDHHFVNLRFPHVTATFWLVSALAVVCTRLARIEAKSAIPD